MVALSPLTSVGARAEAAAARGTVTFINGDVVDRVPWAQVHEDARSVAAALQNRGIGPGSHVALLGPTTRSLVTALQGIWLSGGTAVILPLPMRLGSLDEFVSQTRARMAAADVALVLADPDLAAFIEPAPTDPPMVLFSDLKADASRFSVVDVTPHDLAILQFTSGSTADPKGVMLPHASVCANLDAIAIAGRLVRDDVLVSWLPLYHDMGLIGLLTLPMTTGVDLVLAAPQDFLASPSRWMQWMSDYKGTCTAGPNFSYALSARALKRLDGLDLSHFRLGLNGAEPIDPDSVDRFVEAGARHGMDPRAVFPAFGMAEATLAVTFPEPFTHGMETDAVDRRMLESDRIAAPSATDADGARRLVKLGRPVPGIEVRIADPATGSSMRPREVGEIEIRGTSLMTGYYKRPDATAQTLRDGWLRTGDLGYVVDGQLVVCGRLKDVIIVGGRNVYPEDVERAAAGVEGVRPGNVIAFGVEGRKGQESFVIVAETKGADPSEVRDQVAIRVRQAVGMGPREVVIVAPGSLPKTSSGKLQRSLCRTRYLDEALVNA